MLELQLAYFCMSKRTITYYFELWFCFIPQRGKHMIKKYRGILYLFLSIYILIQATLFPEKPEEFLIYFFQPKLDWRSVVISPYDHVRYLNIIVYCGLAISGAFFFNSAKIFLKYSLQQPGRILLKIPDYGSSPE